MRFRFLIGDLMVLVVPCALVALALRAGDGKSLGEVALAIYLAAVSLATVGAKFHRGSKKAKVFWKGFAVFGWFYFAFGLQFGFERNDEMLVRAGIGLAFALVCGYAARRLVRRELPPPAPAAVAKAE